MKGNADGAEIRNPNIEIRNKSEKRVRRGNWENARAGTFSPFYPFTPLEFISDFVLRISDFARLRRCV
jgi:hypothetical protein